MLVAQESHNSKGLKTPLLSYKIPDNIEKTTPKTLF